MHFPGSFSSVANEMDRADIAGLNIVSSFLACRVVLQTAVGPSRK